MFLNTRDVTHSLKHLKEREKTRWLSRNFGSLLTKTENSRSQIALSSNEPQVLVYRIHFLLLLGGSNARSLMDLSPTFKRNVTIALEPSLTTSTRRGYLERTRQLQYQFFPCYKCKFDDQGKAKSEESAGLKRKFNNCRLTFPFTVTKFSVCMISYAMGFKSICPCFVCTQRTQLLSALHTCRCYWTRNVTCSHQNTGVDRIAGVCRTIIPPTVVLLIADFK